MMNQSKYNFRQENMVLPSMSANLYVVGAGRFGVYVDSWPDGNIACTHLGTSVLTSPSSPTRSDSEKASVLNVLLSM